MKNKKILVIEDNAEILEIILLVIKSKFKFDILEADCVKRAIELLKENPDIDCIFSDYDLGDGTSDEVYRFMKTMPRSIPFILCSGSAAGDRKFTAEDKLSAVIEKPFKSKEVINAINEAIRTPSEEAVDSVPIKYCPMKINALLKLGGINCDFYIKLSDEKYVKLIKAGDIFGQEDLDKYVEKNIEYLYFMANDIGELLNKYTTDLMGIIHAKSLLMEESLHNSTRAYETLYQVISSLGVSQEAFALAKTCTQLALTSIMSDSTVTPFIERVNLKRDNYLSTHSVLLAQVSCLLASMFGWTSETMQYKLAFASIIHDLTLSDNEVAMTELFLLSRKNSPPKGQDSWSKFREHGNEAVELLKRMQNVPSDVDLIIRSHHERPDGTGFPNRLNASQLGQLPSLFIIAHDISNFIWLEGERADLKNFIKSRKNEYVEGVFKKFVETYSSELERFLQRFI